ncbi:MAG: NUDIX hydrolase, partial [Lactobacillus paragasseri]
TLFLAKYNPDQEIKRQESEIKQTAWLNYEDAQKRIREQNFKEFTFEDLSSILEKANDYLSNR